MKPYLYFLLCLFVLSCGKEKTVQLPEIAHSKLNKIYDISAAYLFYDVSQPDSLELNRKNLISTTNWLFNVDKRLSLGQAIPKIMFLQNKKREATLHKNENAKNYFTCNDLAQHNLGFIEFTDVIYHLEEPNKYFGNENNKINADQYIFVNVKSDNSIQINFFTNGCSLIQTSNKLELIKHIKGNLINSGSAIIILEFSKRLSFQDYISLKHKMSQLHLKNVSIAKDEFVFN